jgi:mono/diheme cytochrome c family protein
MLPIPHQLVATATALLAVLSGCASSRQQSPAAAAPTPPADPYHAKSRDTVSATLYNGWKQYVLLCERCHGEDALGTSFAPSLVASLKPDGAVPTEERFIALLTDGRPARGMPPAATLGLDRVYWEGLYQYLKGRSDGALHGGRPALRE